MMRYAHGGPIHLLLMMLKCCKHLKMLITKNTFFHNLIVVLSLGLNPTQDMWDKPNSACGPVSSDGW